ncbi:MAG: hypothetical protein ACK4HV_01495 [Parachlamydiaceae bacterium]
MEINSKFKWERQPHAELIINRAIERAFENPDIKALDDRMRKEASSRLFDWLDHVIVPIEEEKEVLEAGFELLHATPASKIYRHKGAQFPLIIVSENDETGLAVSVDSISDFLLANGLHLLIEGSPFSPYRRALVSSKNEMSFWIVERRSLDYVEPTYFNGEYLITYLEAVEKWSTRPRKLEKEGIIIAQQIAQNMVERLGEAVSASIVCEIERKFWQTRNRAGQVQKARQDRLGLGWANHDHHTFRSSRANFKELVRLFEILGFYSRERFYAGEEAGWGAQVMEHRNVRLVLFLDVDLAADEIAIDFAHQSMPERKRLGTIGLWCALHGDSILQAGMHHLEAQFEFDLLKEHLKEHDVDMMNPFSDFSYLRQAFTKGEIWPIDPSRLDKLVNEGKITPAEREKFLHEGGVGSHLENLQRREGYKGFNQKNVSLIIKETDPRLIKKES